MKIFFLLIFFLASLIFPNENLNESKLKIKNLINEEKDMLNKIKKKEISILKEIDDLQKEIFKSDTELVKIRYSLKTKNEKLAESTKYLSDTEKKIENQKLVFFSIANKINRIYGHNNIAFLEFIFNSNNFNNFKNNLKLSEIFIGSYLRLYNELKDSTNKRKLEIDQIKSYSNEFASLQETNFAISRKRMEKRKTLISLLKKIETEKVFHLKLLEDLKVSQANLDKEIDSFENKETELKGISTLQDNLFFPFDGEIIQTYGRQVNKKFNTIHFNKGITMTSIKNNKINAIYNGIVVFADWFKGYGNLIIINHGDNYYSLYAKAGNLEKALGDLVKTGETIAYAQRDDSNMYLFYFELRHHKNTLDPNVWLKR